MARGARNAGGGLYAPGLSPYGDSGPPPIETNILPGGTPSSDSFPPRVIYRLCPCILMVILRMWRLLSRGVKNRRWYSCAGCGVGAVLQYSLLMGRAMCGLMLKNILKEGSRGAGDDTFIYV